MKVIKGYAAMNEGEFDIENMSFFKSLSKAKRYFKNSQVYKKVEIKFID